MNAVSEFNQRAYELFGRPLVQALSTEFGARLARAFHPLRFQRWAVSDLNPWLWWLGPAAQAVKAQRRPAAPDHPLRRLESTVSDVTSASLDAGRALRDALSEAAFFQVYGNLFALQGRDQECAGGAPAQPVNPRELPFVKQALAAIDQGGYAAGAGAGRVPAGAPGRTAAAFAAASRARPARGLSRFPAGVAARGGAPHRRRAGNHRALRTRSGDRDAARAAGASARTVTACSRWWNGCWPTGACNASGRPRNRKKCSRASVARWASSKPENMNTTTHPPSRPAAGPRAPAGQPPHGRRPIPATLSACPPHSMRTLPASSSRC